MLQETVLYLLIIGLCSLVHTHEKYDFALSFLIMACVSFVFFFFTADYQIDYGLAQTYMLNKAQNANIKLEIISSVPNNILIFPFFVSTIIALLSNTFFYYEKQKKYIAGLFVFNLLSFIMLIAGNNFIQIITFVFIIDILSQLLIRNTNAGRRYSLYNFVADMGLFLVLAMLQGKLDNLDVGNISHYYETGHHRDFIMFVVMLSLFVKFGFFLFQGYWLDLKSAKFHNLYFLPYLSTPMAALILFIKLYPILVVSPSFLPLLNIMVTLTMLWGGIGAVLSPQIKEKFVYCNMLNIAFLVKLIEQNNFLWNVHFSNIVILLFVFNLCLYYLHYEVDRNHAKNKLSLRCVLTAFAFNISALSLQITELSTENNLYLIIAFALLFLFAMTHIFGQINSKLKGKLLEKQTDMRTIFIMLLLIAVCYYLSIGMFAHYWSVCFVFDAFLLLYGLQSFYLLQLSPSLKSKIQNLDLLTLIYRKMIVTPIKNAGLILHILTDFIFLERTLGPVMSVMNQGIIKTYRHISRLGIIYYLLCTVVGILLAIYSFY